MMKIDNDQLTMTSRVPVEGKSSVCVICMKYRIIFRYHQPVSNSIIVYCKHITHERAHARTRVRTHPRELLHTPTGPHTYTLPSLYRYSMPAVMGRSAGNNSGSLAFAINSGTGGQVSPRIWKFFAYKKNG